ncbi:tannase feruloyl esterase [Fusarium heterosporum]|uniref:Carboxylic ester hydrolase n=1 Tax=Fusarium heterosporum TaxID=42747 RepID=A0A8H5TVP7_FUSHE|nr:tannase feruloyl esterase [Fusarium heterosporum]
MVWGLSIILLLTGLSSTSSASLSPGFIEDCESLGQRAHLQNATIHASEAVQAGTNLTFPFYHATCSPTSQVVTSDICRLSFDVATSDNSSVRFEAWLPREWSGRFLGVGNGGLGGCFKYNDINYGASYGFATIGTNNGHDGNQGKPFYNSPGTVEDYAYRSVHLEAVLGKKIVRTFYGSSHKKSYYLGCSTGGRQGFKEAQDFPEDFDGIVAGAPAFDMLALFYWSGVLAQALGKPGSPTYLTTSDWGLIYDNVLEQCDEMDGVKDGVIDDPDLCQYRPEALICGPSQKIGCLSGVKAKTVRTIFAPVSGPNGQFVYPRLQPGANATDRFTSITQPFGYLLDWMRYVTLSDPSWDPWTFTADDWLAISGKDDFGVSTWNGNLTRARDRGTKILHYHGLQDPLITSDNSARYYNYVSRTMGSTSKDMDSFYRYFRISGLGHCSGGTGANMIGGNANSLGPYNPESNVLAAMVDWVEKGKAPNFIKGTQYASGSEKVIAEKKHCQYPRRNVYVKGKPESPDSWRCV